MAARSKQCASTLFRTAKECDEELLRDDAKDYKENFEEHAQYVFSHVQHHWHHEKDGVRIPHAYCRKAGFKIGKAMMKKRACCEEVCKQDFPKTRRLNSVGRVICPGVARRYKAQVKGRRNSLCLLLPRRRCAWLSGCSPAFAVWTGSNTNIMPNYRIPLTEQTHDPECERECLTKVSDRRTAIVAQKGMRAATGDFSGHICKRQPVGRFQLRQAARSLPLFRPKVVSQRSEAGQMAQIVGKMFSTLETRGKMRTAAEETNLAAN